jgi:hypothetical protein
MSWFLRAVTPPGFFTANGTTQQCPPASFRAEWLPPDLASACIPCGEGVFGIATEALTVIDPVTQASSTIAVQAEDTGCCKYRMQLGL